MIPIPPLDGHKILTGLLPDFWYSILAPMEQYGFAILLVLIFLPNIIGTNIFSAISLPLQVFLFSYLIPGLF
jgi:Zn-dependent protease